MSSTAWSPPKRSSARIGRPNLALAHPKLALLAVLALSATLGLYNLSAEGFSNEYYAATVRSMLVSWHNFWYASYDPGGFVSVDKPPIGFWVQAAAATLLGYQGWVLILPQVISAVAAVAVLYHLIARSFGSTAGLAAALVLAVMPISVATARNTTVDMQLVLVVLLAAWCALRAAEQGRVGWLLAAFALVGIGFNIKMLQAFLVLPAIAIVYVVAAQGTLLRRVTHVAVAGVVLSVVSLSWVVAVDLTPPDQRPYVGSSASNSALDLALGYNGLMRLVGLGGSFGPSVVPAPPGAPSQSDGVDTGPAPVQPGDGPQFAVTSIGSENGEPGPLRLLNHQLGGQMSWLLPVGVLGAIAAARRARWRPRLDRRGQTLVFWLTWLVAGAVFFSVANFYHRYYLVMLAPAVAALVGLGSVSLWRAYRSPGPMGWLLPLAVAATAGLQFLLLTSHSEWLPWLTPALVVAVVCAVALAIGKLRRAHVAPGGFPGRPRNSGRLTFVAMGALLAAPVVWAALPVVNARGEMLPIAGPTEFAERPGTQLGPAGSPTTLPPDLYAGQTGSAIVLGGSADAEIDEKLISYLRSNRGSAKWLVATFDSGTASPLIVHTGEPVLALHGFGTDQILSPDQLASMVRRGEVRYFLIPDLGAIDPRPSQSPISPGGVVGPDGGDEAWVRQICTRVPDDLWRSEDGEQCVTAINVLPVTLLDCASAGQ